MQAKLINHNKLLYSDGSILETKILMVSKSQRFPRGYKYPWCISKMEKGQLVTIIPRGKEITGTIAIMKSLTSLSV